MLLPVSIETHADREGLRRVGRVVALTLEETRRSVERLLELDFAILCLDHGAPLTEDPKAAIRELLAAAA